MVSAASETLDEESTKIDVLARDLLASGYGVTEFDAVRVALDLQADITNSREAIEFAQKVIESMTFIFRTEIAPLVLRRSAEERCYEKCSPKARCSRDFGFGVQVDHSFSGSHWIVGGREFDQREVAEHHARRSVLLLRLRSELQQRPEFRRRNGTGKARTKEAGR